ncbi:surface protein-2, partial [Trypanosoma conorhini]
MFSSAALLLLVALISCGSCDVAAVAAVSEPQPTQQPPSTVVLFQRTEGQRSNGVPALTGLTEGKKVYGFAGHSLVHAGGVTVALAKARYGPGLISDVGIWATCISCSGGGGGSSGCTPLATVADAAPGSGCRWTKAVPSGSDEQSGSPVFRYGPRAVVKDNKILLLLMSYTEPTGKQKPNSQGSWEAA